MQIVFKIAFVTADTTYILTKLNVIETGTKFLRQNKMRCCENKSKV